MKKILLCFALLTAIAIHDPIVAGDFSAYGSYWDTSIAKGVYGAGVALGFPLANSEHFSVQGRAGYFTSELGGGTSLNGLRVLPVEALLKFHFAPNSTFGNAYVGAGASYFVLDANNTVIPDEVGWTAVAGVTLPNKFGPSFLLEAQFRDNNDTNVDLSGLTGNAGIQWRW